MGESDHCYFSTVDAVATVDVLTASYNDVNLSKLELYILHDY